MHLILLVICSIESKAIPEGEGRQHHDDHAELQSEEVSPLHLSVAKNKIKKTFITILFQYGFLMNTQVYIMPILLIKHMCNYTLNGVWRYEHARFCVEGFTHCIT